ncbi:hypothetical protein EPVG_00258 [Emiliania huxleyi virus 201]|nr:hypothetical protein ELVG_00045 [Emiliania huxleyi virus 203]AET98145.1 hypothetical protein EPVG_00258 [Emiliania huxleyi virus 201]
MSKQQKVNAFDKLMTASRQLNDVYHVELYDDGVVRYTDTLPESRWSSAPFNSCIRRGSRKYTTRIQLHDKRTSARVTYHPKFRLQKIPVHHLKSALQKNVRTGNVVGALNIAWTCTCNPDGLRELLRRLPIIAIEDAIVPFNFNLITWLMLASHSHSYEFTNHDIQQIIKFVYYIATVMYRDPMFDIVEDAPVFNIANTPLANSIILRESFGGMKGDIEMLKCAAKKWQCRYYDKIALVSYNTVFGFMKPGKYVHERMINETDIPLSAVDFHCDSRILENIPRDETSYTKEMQRKAMWDCSSSLNLKTDWINGKFLHTGDDTMYAQKQLAKLSCKKYEPETEIERVWASIHNHVRGSASFIIQRIIRGIKASECV